MEYVLTEQERAFFADKQAMVYAIQGQIAGGLELLARLHGFTGPFEVTPGFERLVTKGKEQPDGSVEAMAEPAVRAPELLNGRTDV